MGFKPGQSGNLSGRPKMTIAGEDSPVKYKSSILTIKGKIERFLKKNMTGRQLQLMYNGLKEQQRLEMLMQLLPYTVARVQADSLSEDELLAVYERLEKKITNDAATQKKAG